MEDVSITVMVDYAASRETITRDEFEESTRGLLDQTLGCVEEVLENANMDSNVTMNELDGIVVAEGSTKMPMVRQHIEQFNTNHIELYSAVDPALKSLGSIVGPDGSFSTLIARGTQLSAVARRTFRSGCAGTGQLVIPIAQAAYSSAIDYQTLGKLYIEVPVDLSRGASINLEIGLHTNSKIVFSALVNETGISIPATLDQSGRELGSRPGPATDDNRFAVFYSEQTEVGLVGSLIAYAYSPEVDVRALAEEAS